MKKILLLLLVLALPGLAWGGMLIGSGSGIKPIEFTCSSTPSIVATTGSGTTDVFSSEARYIIGQFVVSSNSKNICKVEWELRTFGGDISGKAYTCQVYTTDAEDINDTNFSIVSLKGVSSTLSGSVITAESVLYVFEFATPITVDQTDVIVLSSVGYDEVNYPKIALSTVDQDSGYSCYVRFSESGVFSNINTAWDFNYKLYEVE